jgi:hypothetical protein
MFQSCALWKFRHVLQLFVGDYWSLETSTWVMMLLGFAGMSFAGYLRSHRRHVICRLILFN